MPALVVDDNAVNRRILSEQLARLGMKPAQADGGAAALRMLEAAAQTRRARTGSCCSTSTCRTSTASASPTRIAARPEFAGRHRHHAHVGRAATTTWSAAAS